MHTRSGAGLPPGKDERLSILLYRGLAPSCSLVLPRALSCSHTLSCALSHCTFAPSRCILTTTWGHLAPVCFACCRCSHHGRRAIPCVYERPNQKTYYDLRLNIPRQIEREFHGKPNVNSTAKRTGIPRESEQQGAVAATRVNDGTLDNFVGSAGWQTSG
jgi:hypothetical protein